MRRWKTAASTPHCDAVARLSRKRPSEKPFPSLGQSFQTASFQYLSAVNGKAV
ncbi:hypothetical protein NEIELOOT_02844 [Neisseria elongata subsp. glycolytica ATCC 29315]|uniref:Uncharacterized protein n=1 Tax=Neisseria elongata subsp. glycolytica ATCC 29315 TaxID=546263 RepID=D4DUP9_NEIEG|nr:hypothetical protein NEIELOOT_02844 [Neisseria elongata subsp. glycolytica ATCC 29315]